MDPTATMTIDPCRPAAGRADRRQSGAAAAETVLSLAILATIVLGTAQSATRIQRLAHSDTIRTFVQRELMAATLRVARDTGQGRVDAVSGDGSSFSLQLPVDPDGDGSVLDGLGAVQWGATVSGVPVAGAVATYQYVGDRTLDEAVSGADLNGDGDQADQFDLGHLELTSGGTGVRLTGSYLLQPTGAWGSDLDGDLVADPLFRLDNTGEVNVASFDFTALGALPGGDFAPSRSRFSVVLVNDDL